MIAIIEGCGSNITSVKFALARLGIESILTSDPQLIKNASQVILPGVNHAKTAMHNLQRLQLDQLIKQLTQPVLGICLGMQLFYEHTTEGSLDCLGIIPGTVTRLTGSQNEHIPHMGWNELQFINPNHPLYNALKAKAYTYFVHSYAAPVNTHTVAVTEHAEPFTSIVQYKNFTGMQFHPEKSGYLGEQLLTSFLQSTLL